MQVSKWYKWYFDKSVNMIRRYRIVNDVRKWQNLPTKQYKQLDVYARDSLIKRLNASYESQKLNAEKRYDFDHAFINKTVLEAFEHSLRAGARDRDHINALMYYVTEYVLKYFVHIKKQPDPSHWKKYEAGYGKFLLSKKLGHSSIKRVMATTNRFISFLYETYPDEVRLTVLRPVSAEEIQALERNAPNKSRRKFITDKDWQKICEKAAPDLLPALKLSYYFGLRIAEVLALTTDDIYEDCLRIERQLISIEPFRKTGPLKNNSEPRDIPYWFTTPAETYSLVLRIKLIHPDTLSHRIADFMHEVGLPFKHHDFRRTFITRANRLYARADVKLAAGHKDSRTTDIYVQDDRPLGRKRYKPAALRVAE